MEHNDLMEFLFPGFGTVVWFFLAACLFWLATYLIYLTQDYVKGGWKTTIKITVGVLITSFLIGVLLDSALYRTLGAGVAVALQAFIAGVSVSSFKQKRVKAKR